MQVTQETTDEVIGIGRWGHLVDMPRNDEQSADVLPFIASYSAETIDDWSEAVVRGKKMKVMVKLIEEPQEKRVGDQKKFMKRYRVLHLGIPEPATTDEKKIVEEQGMEVFLRLFGLRLSDFDDGPIYFQEIWDELESSDKTEQQFTRTELIVPTLPGRVYWREIPFTFYNPMTTRPDPEKPPLLDLAVLNLSHYRNSADLEHGLHFTGLPTPWAAGFKAAQGELFIGSAAAWVTDEPQAKAGYLEFTGAGLGAIEKRDGAEEDGRWHRWGRVYSNRPARPVVPRRRRRSR